MSKILLFIFAALSSIILISCTACIVKYDIVGTVIALPAVIVAKAFFVAHIPSYVVFATTIAISPKLIIAFFVCGAVYELAIYCFYNQAQTGKFFKEVLDQASGRKQKTITNLLSDNAIITIKTTLL